MKKIFLFIIITITFSNINVFAQSDKEQNPLNYPYYIYGEQEITGAKTSKLNNIDYKGFASEIPSGGSLSGKLDEEEKFEYIFKDVSTNPKINIGNNRLQYWRQIEGTWITDIESGSGISSYRTDNPSTFLLVLDCSNSLGDDFLKVKEGAKTIINELARASLNGNIKVNIICFSSKAKTQILGFKPLTPENKAIMINFIDRQTKVVNATTMYSAINQGIDLQIKTAQNINAKNYEGSHIIIFTDGLDNGSRIEEKQLYAKKDVYNFVKEKIHTTKIKGENLNSWMIVMQGTDIQDSQIDMMKAELKPLASSSSQFIWCDDPSELGEKFSYVAKQLTLRWENLNCTSALNHEGPVCWTYGTPKIEAPAPAPTPAPAPKPTTDKHLLLGLNYGLGFCIPLIYDSGHFKTGIGIDFAYPITKSFGLGTYLSGGYSFVQWGLLTTIGNYHDKKTAFVGGLGLDACFQDGISFDIRGGVMIKKGFYFMLDLSAGQNVAMTFNVGYNFGSLFSVR